MADSSKNQKLRPGFPFWIPLGLLVVCFIVSLPTIRSVIRHWPPDWVERRTQRAVVFTNIEAHGGWNEFKSECDFLISYSRTNEQSQWFTSLGDKFDKYPEPCKIFSNLKPRQVDVYAFSNKTPYVVVYVFGMHRTGARDTPAYYLVYQQLTNSDKCVAADLLGTINLKPSKLTDSVFEFY
ncbi:MAG TPA: hypothetical protein VK815_14985 [Candidatus Acidoferrales bacterium]|nr:hypothetical protein [Candidatus Acidoferrales bacterium]